MKREHLELCTSLLQCVYDLLEGEFLTAQVNGATVGAAQGHAKIHLKHEDYNKIFNEDEYSIEDFDDYWRLSTFVNGIEIIAMVDKE